MELRDKAGHLRSRLERANADPFVSGCIQRLLDALGANFEDIRQGVLLSRLRSLDAIKDAYDNEESRQELYPDAIAAIIDTVETLRDLLAALPDVRKIEAERLALEIQSSPYAVEAIQHLNSNFNRAVTETSDIMTRAAIEAVVAHEVDIREARRNDVKAKLLANSWLVKRNLISAAIGVIRYGRHLADISKPSFEDGVRDVARVAPVAGLAALLGWVAGPVSGIAAFSVGFKPIMDAISQFKKSGKLPRV